MSEYLFSMAINVVLNVIKISTKNAKKKAKYKTILINVAAEIERLYPDSF
jgi:hypothetical protein